MTVLCATGHRPDKLGGYSPTIELRLNTVAEWHLMNDTPGLMVVGMAPGWDQAVARTCAKLGIPFIAAVPFEGQELRWPAPAQRRYHILLSKAKEVKVISPGPYEQWKMFKRNEWMVDNSDGCVALWNGDHSGGTYDTVKYVERRQQARPDYTFVNLWPEWEKLNGTRL